MCLLRGMGLVFKRKSRYFGEALINQIPTTPPLLTVTHNEHISEAAAAAALLSQTEHTCNPLPCPP